MKPDKEPTFVGEEITVLETSEGGSPLRFLWGGDEHQVQEILRNWQDWGFSTVASRRDWRNRRHRNYFEVKTDAGLHALLYLDRGVKPSNPRKWIILEVYK